jgi:hypothetical protein
VEHPGARAHPWAATAQPTVTRGTLATCAGGLAAAAPVATALQRSCTETSVYAKCNKVRRRWRCAQLGPWRLVVAWPRVRAVATTWCTGGGTDGRGGPPVRGGNAAVARVHDPARHCNGGGEGAAPTGQQQLELRLRHGDGEGELGKGGHGSDRLGSRNERGLSSASATHEGLAWHMDRDGAPSSGMAATSRTGVPV